MGKNIIVIASGRSGSTSLTVAIGKQLRKQAIFEPYDYGKGNVYKNKLIKHILYDYGGAEQLKESIEKDDKVILLTRNNIMNVYESFNYTRHNLEVSFHQPYYYDIEEPVDQSIFNRAVEQHEAIKQLSKDLDIPYLVYEELYTKDFVSFNKSVDKIGLNLDREILKQDLDIKKKYRKNKPLDLI